MATAFRPTLTSMVVGTAVAGVAALTLFWLLPSSIIRGWAVVAIAVWAGVTTGARAEGRATSWGQAMARGCVAALAAGLTLWLLGRH